MNILFVSNVFPDQAQPSRGAYNLQTCCALAKSHHVRVISPRPWLDAARALFKGSMFLPTSSCSDAGISVQYPTFWYPPKVLHHAYGDFLWSSLKPVVEQLTKNFRPDAVLSYWTHPDGDAAVRIAERFDVPSAVITGGSDVLLLPNCPKRAKSVRRVLERCDAVLTVSSGVRNAVEKLGIDPSKVHVVPQGVDEKVFHSGSQTDARLKLTRDHAFLRHDRPLLLWVGRMVDLKRLDVLLEGVKELDRRKVEHTLCLIGDGPERRVVEQMVMERNLASSVHLIGNIAPNELGDWYRAADMTVLTSDSEGLPNVLRESLACGTPYVTTDVGSVRELTDGPFAEFTPPGDSSAFADGVVMMLKRIDSKLPPPSRTWDDRASEILAILDECKVRTPEPAAHARCEVVV